ncbi:MAG: polyprenyl synthetase family protein [Actinobacteria bacterium]|nr:polyprenyl synthetase family protein [Actinomycetota bacterium]
MNQYPDFLTGLINEKINEYVAEYWQAPGILRKAISYSLKNAGKRFRPVLCLLTAASLGKEYEIAYPTAIAIEFIHTYSLIHDDLPSIDNDDFRRGMPTCHRVFGEDIAILTGDALFAEAFNLILRHQKASSEKMVRILYEIGYASGAQGMVAGQIIDVFYAGKKISKKMLDFMHQNKTGKLITSSVRCGAIIADAKDDFLKKFTDYANNIGLAFQITDDILDLESTNEAMGKTAGKDLAQNKNTFPSMYGISKSKKIAEERVSEAIEIISGMNIEKEQLINIARFILQRKN